MARKDDTLLTPSLIEILERLSMVDRSMLERAASPGSAGPPKAADLGIDFYEYGVYQPGLDVKHVDWTVYGRTGELLVKAYETHRDLPVCVLLDMSASMGLGEPPKFDLALRLAAAMAYVGLVNYHPVRVIGFAKGRLKVLPHRIGRESVYQVLDFVQALTPSGETSLVEGIAAGLEGAPRQGGRIFLVSDFLDPQGLSRPFGLLGTTRRRLDLVLVASGDEAELPTGEVTLVDPETGEETDRTIDEDTVRRYSENFEAHRRELRRRAHDIEARLVTVSSDMSVEEAVLEVLG